MQHPMVNGPGLDCSHARCGRVGIDSDQRDPAGCRGAQPGPGVIHNLSCQWAKGPAARVDKSQDHFAAAQGRKSNGVTELVDKVEVRREIARHWKAGGGELSRLRCRLLM